MGTAGLNFIVPMWPVLIEKPAGLGFQGDNLFSLLVSPDYNICDDIRGEWEMKKYIITLPICLAAYATASFIQKYQDATHSDIGEKILKLIHVNGTWQIISENWKPLKR